MMFNAELLGLKTTHKSKKWLFIIIGILSKSKIRQIVEKGAKFDLNINNRNFIKK